MQASAWQHQIKPPFIVSRAILLLGNQRSGMESSHAAISSELVL
jgi:hypothetical protein